MSYKERDVNRNAWSKVVEQIRTYPCLYLKNKMSYKERDVNRNAWSKVVENLDFIQNVYKCRHEKLNDCCCAAPFT